MSDHLSEREKELEDFRRGKIKKYERTKKANIARNTKDAPDLIVQKFRAFGAGHGIPESEMLALLKTLAEVKSRQLVSTVLGIAVYRWEKDGKS